jgi:hypothetical protein
MRASAALFADEPAERRAQTREEPDDGIGFRSIRDAERRSGFERAGSLARFGARAVQPRLAIRAAPRGALTSLQKRALQRARHLVAQRTVPAWELASDAISRHERIECDGVCIERRVCK